MSEWDTDETFRILQNYEHLYWESLECLNAFSPSSAIKQLCYRHEDLFDGVDLDDVDYLAIVDWLQEDEED